ncbi:glycerol-3-phosphate dehydrogenase, mitochondrial [Pristis pectinata]|uniref:glycerol-3-phosphate dehydrogenase, mitochondrial n=1 Tax=Pristis pectinata TaxID=685728 RepID=UPI00223E7CB1|nr:glycerol-3-phosphate dehydrogenase, mitochondrial [Pristis pectinata]XP_051883904.1 glycerol-3-phosphate dehydrogenase, mitochondrial [Pristis pectinata]XP_051883913.1 glycerol-3-phosphate dehydrogenase, mitochondrial [Pristis pectinata]XP_051883921.1 glycerol-3-phosphate dehydrogenase, mitochondrial [Pristis pectinata]
MAFQKIAGGVFLLGGSTLTTILGLSQIIDNRANLARLSDVQASELLNRECPESELPSREAQLYTLQTTKEFDVLIIGGGATGSGCALDAVTRGLRTALIEREDFSSGTSSKSTKLIHGGVRYLQKALTNLDYEQYKLVREALRERANLLEVAPHIARQLPIMLPLYKWWHLPYYWAGIKMYDFVAGSQCLTSSYILTKSRALELFPMLKKEKLLGAVVYYDGQHNDARMNLVIALTAARYGAAIANYVEAVKLLKSTDPDTGKQYICGAECKDVETGELFQVRAKCVINATGPFTDTLREMDDKGVGKICQASAGVHVVLPGYYSPEAMGLLDPATSDGRVIFFLPWEGMVIAGTTDTPTEITAKPIPHEEEINFILSEIRNYLSPDVKVRRGDVLAAWSGIRPLVSDPNSKDTQSISRNHVVMVTDSRLVTIAGGKWTTYRIMAEDAINAAIKSCNLNATKPCKTVGLLLEGAHDWSPTLHIRLVQYYGLGTEVARHLASTYGGKAFEVAKLAKVTGRKWPLVGKRLVADFPYIEAEVRYAVKEYACTAVDVLARRTRLSFLNVQAAEDALPRIVELMAAELNWSEKRIQDELKAAKEFLYYEMGYKVRSDQLSNTEINLSPADVDRYKKRFQKFDDDKKGFITILDVQRVLESIGYQVDEATLHEMLTEVDINKNGQVELIEFLQLMSAIQKGSVSGSRLAILMKTAEENLNREDPIPVSRSGGGL